MAHGLMEVLVHATSPHLLCCHIIAAFFDSNPPGNDRQAASTVYSQLLLDHVDDLTPADVQDLCTRHTTKSPFPR